MIDRYSRQTLFPEIGEEGQRKLGNSSVVITVDAQEMVVFPDGRAIVRNTTDKSLARGLYAKYIGT